MRPATIHSADPKSNGAGGSNPRRLRLQSRAFHVARDRANRAAVRLLPPCTALLCCVAFAGPARAYEDQLTLGFGAGYAHAAASSLPRNGVLFDVSASTGLGPVWSLRGRASYAVHPAARPLHVTLLDAEVLYLIDVLEIVPYFGVGAGATGRVRDGVLGVDATVHAVIGLDYLLSRALTLELDARPYLLMTELDGAPVYFGVTAGVVWMFDS